MTLIEMIVVMAISATLLSMLLVGVATVQRRARAVKCVANLKGIGDLATVYANEHGGRMVPFYGRDHANLDAGTATPQDAWYVELLALATGEPSKDSIDFNQLPSDAELFFCPSDRNPAFSRDNLSYGLNADVLDANGDPYTSATPSDDVDGVPDQYYMTDITNPAEFIFMADAGLIERDDYTDRNLSSWITSPALKSSGAGWPRPASGIHNEEANVLFGDLHVASTPARRPGHDLGGHINDTASEAARQWTLGNR